MKTQIQIDVENLKKAEMMLIEAQYKGMVITTISLTGLLAIATISLLSLFIF